MICWMFLFPSIEGIRETQPVPSVTEFRTDVSLVVYNGQTPMLTFVLLPVCNESK
jgi:hypothetical protein